MSEDAVTVERLVLGGEQVIIIRTGIGTTPYLVGRLDG